MAAKSSALDQSILALLFNATAITNVAQNGTSPISVVWVSLHTAQPTTQSSSEATYTGYARQSCSRTSSGWTVSSGTATLVNPLSFPLCTAGSNVITHVGIGTSQTGAGVLWYYAPASSSITVSAGITPTVNTLTISET